MIGTLVKKIFGSRNERLLKQMNRSVARINTLEAEISALTDEQLRAKTADFRARLSAGQSLDDILPEAFAVVREASKRVLGLRHFDVQLIGGMTLDSGKIAEMRTGEGKTLVATLPAYLNALPGKGVHVVTVNDYLARRDAEWMGRVYGFLGMSTGVIYSGQSQEEKRAAYRADITYGTNNEYGFDYLRDNMAFSMDEKAQRGLHYAIVDEVDSILIDEARTPLIISGPVDESSDVYGHINTLVPKLVRQQEEEGPGDYWVDEKLRQVFLSEEGHQHVEELLMQAGLLKEDDSLYDTANISLMHHLNAGLRAHSLYQRNVHYIVRDAKIVIVDEFTGRTMPGRRWSEGLHQAIEAKEGVMVQQENQTLASITFQNYFRLYEKLSGMTGTADTEAFEFQQIYNLEVIVIPTNRPVQRKDHGDLVFLSKQEKYAAVITDIKDCIARNQPVLVGTASIDASELLSGALKQEGIKHEVLNAKQHEREAEIIANAGMPGAVTIATNMAGRGTDIVLGGSLEAVLKALGENAEESVQRSQREAWQQRHDQVLQAGGLHVIGTERNESRRVDNQLRGRSGRQGDPGSSRFYVSLEDDLMRIFASQRIAGLMQKLGMQRGESIEHPWVSRAIENAQRKVEGHNFDIRKQLLEYDDVANDQRKVIYQQRDELMAAEDIGDTIRELREIVVNRLIDEHIPPQSLEEQWDLPGLRAAMQKEFGADLDLQGWLAADKNLHEEPLRARILEEITQAYTAKEAVTGSAVMRHFEKAVMLQVLDHLWKEHLAAMDYLRQGIGLRGYAAKNPKQEYKREAFELFSRLLNNIQHEVIKIASLAQVRTEQDVESVEAQRRAKAEVELKHEEVAAIGQPVEAAAADTESQTYVREGQKTGRNDPCPCGSGKKFKHCHGVLS